MKQRIKGWMQLAVAINLLAGLVTMTPAAQAEFPDVPVEATLDVAAESAGATRSFQPVDGLTGAGVTVAVVIFVMMNTHHVTLSFVLGGPVKVRLIFLMMMTFFVGMLATSLITMVWRLRPRRTPAPEVSGDKDVAVEQ